MDKLQLRWMVMVIRLLKALLFHLVLFPGTGKSTSMTGPLERLFYEADALTDQLQNLEKQK